MPDPNQTPYGAPQNQYGAPGLQILNESFTVRKKCLRIFILAFPQQGAGYPGSQPGGYPQQAQSNYPSYPPAAQGKRKRKFQSLLHIFLNKF